MSFDISKDFAFSAGHRLAGLAPGHPCGRVHGHNYLVRVQVSGPVSSPPGFIIDYGDLSPFGAWLDSALDHRWLGFGDLAEVSVTTAPHTVAAVSFNPTAENLADFLRDWLTGHLLVLEDPGLTVAVGVAETPKTWAWAR